MKVLKIRREAKIERNRERQRESERERQRGRDNLQQDSSEPHGPVRKKGKNDALIKIE